MAAPATPPNRARISFHASPIEDWGDHVEQVARARLPTDAAPSPPVLGSEPDGSPAVPRALRVAPADRLRDPLRDSYDAVRGSVPAEGDRGRWLDARELLVAQGLAEARAAACPTRASFWTSEQGRLRAERVAVAEAAKRAEAARLEIARSRLDEYLPFVPVRERPLGARWEVARGADGRPTGWRLGLRVFASVTQVTRWLESVGVERLPLGPPFATDRRGGGR